MWRAGVLAVLASAGCDQIFGLGQTAVGGACGSATACAAPDVCDATTHTCVQCTAAEPAACTGATPVCGSDDTCRGCVAHADCPSDVCSPDGSCADPSTIAYVTPAGVDPGSGASGELCAQTEPCATVNGALTSAKATIKVRGSIVGSTVIPDGRTLEIVGDRDAVLHADGSAAVAIKGASIVTLRDLEITAGSDGIEVVGTNTTASVTVLHCDITANTEFGIEVTGAPSGAQPSLTVSRSTIENNPGGGIAVDGAVFQIVGNVFFANGSLASPYGGLTLGTSGQGNRLEFNSFSGNHSSIFAPAIDCKASVAASDNLAAFDTGSGSGSATPEIAASAGCTFTYTITFPSPPPGGIANQMADPAFVDRVQGDLHLEPSSPARGAANPAADLTGIAHDDPDGVQRVSPADIGAYQHAP